MEKLFGKKLLTKDGSEKDTTEVLKDKRVAIYFSAHWCPPCRRFTPILKDFYSTAHLLNESKDFEVVFVSSDRSEDAFKEYYGEMPWLAVPYSADEVRTKLGKKFKVEGIPTLASVNSEGKLITADGTQIVGGGESVKELFSEPPPLFDMFSGIELVDNKGEVKTSITEVAEKNTVLGLYFSAHWCGPCRMFTPKLIEAYKQLAKDGKKMQIVFCSSDQDEDAMKSYFSSMPWLALPYKHQDLVKKLKQRFGVRGIPTLVLVDAQGNTISTEGRGYIELPEEFPWSGPKKPLQKVNSISLDAINAAPTLLALFSTQAEMDKAGPVLQQVAEAYASKFKSEKKGGGEEDDDEEEFPPLSFLYGLHEGGSLVERVSGFLGVSPAEGKPALLICNLPGQKKYLPAAEGMALDEAGLKAFVEDFLGDKSKIVEKDARE